MLNSATALLNFADADAQFQRRYCSISPAEALNFNAVCTYSLSYIDDNKVLEKYINILKQSVELSSNFRFVNNRLDLAHVLSGEEAQKYKQEALENVECVFTEEELSHINDEDWLKKKLNSQSYINEFILGTHMTSIVYEAKFGK